MNNWTGGVYEHVMVKASLLGASSVICHLWRSSWQLGSFWRSFWSPQIVSGVCLILSQTFWAFEKRIEVFMRFQSWAIGRDRSWSYFLGILLIILVVFNAGFGPNDVVFGWRYRDPRTWTKARIAWPQGVAPFLVISVTGPRLFARFGFVVGSERFRPPFGSGRSRCFVSSSSWHAQCLAPVALLWSTACSHCPDWRWVSTSCGSASLACLCCVWSLSDAWRGTWRPCRFR